MHFRNDNSQESPTDKNKTITRKGFLNKFRRSMSISNDSTNETTQNSNKPQSTFYVTDTINIEDNKENNKVNVSPKIYKALPIRPQNPPPPAPLNVGKYYFKIVFYC